MSPSWPTADAPCPHCGSLVWFTTARTVQSSAQPAPAAPTAPAGDFTLDDFRKQFELMKTLGSMRELMAPFPGMSEMISKKDDPEADVRRIQGIIDAMTKQERRDPDVIDISRCRRIAAGSATEPHEIEEFLAQFGQVRTLMRQLAEMSFWQRLKMVAGFGRPALRCQTPTLPSGQGER